MPKNLFAALMSSTILLSLTVNHLMSVFSTYEERFYRRKYEDIASCSSCSTFILGSSDAAHSVKPTSTTAFNASFNGSNPLFNLRLIQAIVTLNKSPQNLRFIYVVSPSTFSRLNRVWDHDKIYRHHLSFGFDDFISSFPIFSSQYIVKGLAKSYMLATRQQPSNCGIDISHYSRGFAPFKACLPQDPSAIVDLPHQELDIIEEFIALIEYCNQHSIKLQLALYPLNPAFDTQSNNYVRYQQLLANLLSRYGHLVLTDLRALYIPPNHFEDGVHVNINGAVKISSVLNSLIRK